MVAEAHYRNLGNEMREALRPIIDVVERVAPGVVDLARSESRPGFAVRLAERPFPPRYQEDLRRAVEQVLERLPAEARPAAPLAAAPAPSVPRLGLLRRLFSTVQRLFRA